MTPLFSGLGDEMAKLANKIRQKQNTLIYEQWFHIYSSRITPLGAHPPEPLSFNISDSQLFTILYIFYNKYTCFI